MSRSLPSKYLKILILYPLLYSLAVYTFMAVNSIFGNDTLPIIYSSAVLAALPLFYYGVLFWFVQKKFGRHVAYTLGLISVYIPSAIALTRNGYHSSFEIINLSGVMFLSSMLGPQFTVSLFGLHLLAILLNGTGALQTPDFIPFGYIDTLIFAGVSLLGWLFFRQYYVAEQRDVKGLQRALRREQLRSEAIISSLTDGVVIIGKQNVIQFCNTPALTLLQVTKKDILGKKFDDFFSHYAINSKKISPQKITALLEKIDLSFTISPYVDGEPVVLSGVITPIYDEDGAITAHLLTMHDISSYIHVQQLKDDFINIGSHELRTPMTVIAGYADLLLNPMFGELNDKQRGYVERTKSTTKQLIAIVNNMLDLTKLEGGKRDNTPEDLDLTTVIASVTETQTAEADAKNLTITAQHPDMPIAIHLDKSRLEQVYGNVLSNAIKFSPDDETISITITHDTTKNYASVIVTDHGPGVPEEMQVGIFEKFSRNKLRVSAELPGTGLGLAISRTIVEEWGGVIDIKSDGEHGSTFTFTLPTTRKDTA